MKAIKEREKKASIKELSYEDLLEEIIRNPAFRAMEKHLANELLEARKVLKEIRQVAPRGKAVVIAIITRYFAKKT